MARGSAVGVSLRSVLEKVDEVSGEGQTWSSPGRSANVAYQNTTGRTIFVSFFAAGPSGYLIQVSPDGSSGWVTVGITGVASNANSGTCFPVRHGEYYRVKGGARCAERR